jgi:hypothetical protein
MEHEYNFFDHALRHDPQGWRVPRYLRQVPWSCRANNDSLGLRVKVAASKSRDSQLLLIHDDLAGGHVTRLLRSQERGSRGCTYQSNVIQVFRAHGECERWAWKAGQSNFTVSKVSHVQTSREQVSHILDPLSLHMDFVHGRHLS